MADWECRVCWEEENEWKRVVGSPRSKSESMRAPFLEEKSPNPSWSPRASNKTHDEIAFIIPAAKGAKRRLELTFLFSGGSVLILDVCDFLESVGITSTDSSPPASPSAVTFQVPIHSPSSDSSDRDDQSIRSTTSDSSADIKYDGAGKSGT